ncbi:MAG: DUF368 domain-containing protein [Deferrisomatales bacterium]|nr:DUF368 domain-containing protein [Deferrisomatales bacterium]
MVSSTPSSFPRTSGSGSLLARSTLGGTLMGLANLVPGISGGTMLLAAGVYPEFIDAIAELTTLRFRRRSLLVLGTVGLFALAGIVLFAGPIKELVVHHRWIMYSLFIGLTLGGVPVVWRLARPAAPALWAGVAAGFAGMVALALAQAGEAGSGAAGSGAGVLFIAGLAGASAMILPGVSGGYLLLVLGQYVPILTAIDGVKQALRAGQFAAAVEPCLTVLLPVGLGVVAGVVGVSNLLRWFLTRWEKATLGVLLGLLLGAVVGLWPFQQTVAPVPGETVIKGRLVTAETLAQIAPKDYPTTFFRPSPAQVAGASGLVLAGAAITLLVARFGRDAPSGDD